MNKNMSGLKKKDEDCPEDHYFMNEEKSDVVFIVEGQRLPAHKLILSYKNNLFRVMFSDIFKESKDKEVLIKDTTYEAFKTLVYFLYYDKLVVKDEDFKLIEEICKLCDRYDANRLMNKIEEYLVKINKTFNNWDTISRIAFTYKMNELMENVKTFIGNNFDTLIDRQDINQLKQLFEPSKDCLMEVMLKRYHKLRTYYKKVLKPSTSDKIKVISGEDCGKTGTLFSIDGSEGVVDFYSAISVLPLKYLRRKWSLLFRKVTMPK